MHPAFYVVDHRIGRHDPVPFAEKPSVKRGRPEALRLSPPPPGIPLVQYAPVRAAAPSPPRPEQASWLSRLLRGLRHAPAT